MTRLSLLTLIVTMSAVCASPGLFAEEAATAATPQQEADEAAAEDEAAAKIDGEIKSPLTGITVQAQFISQPSGEEKPLVLGYLKNKEHTYLVKCTDDEVRKQLEALNGKEILAFGKERNKGKYFILQSIQLGDDGAVNRRKKKGF